MMEACADTTFNSADVFFFNLAEVCFSPRFRERNSLKRPQRGLCRVRRQRYSAAFAPRHVSGWGRTGGREMGEGGEKGGAGVTRSA